MDKKLKIITGHYGSGKTEFAINYALHRAKEDRKITLCDLDIVNPFFRSREKYKILEDEGVRILATNLGKGISADLPALDPQILSVFNDHFYENIMDLGGDHVGAKLLGRFRNRIIPGCYEMWMVVNANRKETSTPSLALQLVEMIEDASGLRITGLINNTHIVKDTIFDDVLSGNKLCEAIGKVKKIPIIYNCINASVKNVDASRLKGQVFPLKIYLRPKWM